MKTKFLITTMVALAQFGCFVSYKSATKDTPEIPAPGPNLPDPKNAPIDTQELKNVLEKTEYHGKASLDITGAVSQKLEIDSAIGDKVACILDKGTFHIWGLRKVDEFKSSLLIDIKNSGVPTGTLSFNKGNVPSQSILILTRPDNYFWAPGDAPACDIAFSHDEKTLHATFECRDFNEVGDPDSGDIKISVKGTIECEIQDWNL